MKKKTWIGIAIVAVIAIGGAVWLGQGKKEETISVSTGEVKTENVVETLATSGQLVPNQSQSLLGTGNVTDLEVKVGDTVKKDDVLATYDSGMELKAPFDGTVTQVNIKENQPDTSSQAGKAAIVVDDLSTLKVELNLSNSEAQAVKVDQKATITSGSATFPGKVAQKDPVATANQSATGVTSSLAAVVTFDKAPKDLYAGFDVDVDITTNTAENVVAMPIEALTYNDKNEPLVYVLKDGKIKITKIKIGIQSDTLVEVTEGLQSGDKVVLSPGSELKDGTAVTAE